MAAEHVPLLLLLSLAAAANTTDARPPMTAPDQPKAVVSDLRNLVKQRLSASGLTPETSDTLRQTIQFYNFPNFPNNFFNQACFRGYWRNC